MTEQSIIGIDLGGTNLKAGLVSNKKLSSILSRPINARGTAEEVLQEVFSITDQLINSSIVAIGIGIPGLIDPEKGIAFDVLNIPAWNEINIKKLMEDRYKLPVLFDNDANCFALGEFYFGKGIGTTNMVGLTIGTGLGAGIILDKKLYPGRYGGAGEFGLIEYLDQNIEYYASGQFFKNVYGVDGETVFQNASNGDREAIGMLEELGTHLGNAIKTVLYALDVELIILGGAARHAFPFFSKTMWQQIKTLAFKRAADNLKVEISELENSGILGAAALHYNY